MARQIWKYVPVKSTLLELKKGDLFQMDKVYVACTDGRPLTEEEKLKFPKSTGIIETGRYILDPEWNGKDDGQPY